MTPAQRKVLLASAAALDREADIIKNDHTDLLGKWDSGAIDERRDHNEMRLYASRLRRMAQCPLSQPRSRKEKRT